MDGAQAGHRNRTIVVNAFATMSRRAWRFCDEAFGVSLSEAASSADLGGSSKYSTENIED